MSQVNSIRDGYLYPVAAHCMRTFLNASPGRVVRYADRQRDAGSAS